MTKERTMTNRTRIIQTAGEMLYRQGYNSTSVDDIAAAAGVSKSNFYYHFPSKEDLGLAVLSVRREQLESLLIGTLRDETQRPLARLKDFLTALVDHQENQLDRRGCPFGNLVAEMTEHSERMRCFLSGVFSEMIGDIAGVIEEGQQLGEVRTDLDAHELATLLVQVIQGMQLIVKCDRDSNGARTSGKLLIDLIASRPSGQTLKRNDR
jgi:TetR/AcrR family transcriptional repressor of nem operon